MSEKPKLLFCPFCGSTDLYHDDCGRGRAVECQKCNAKLWNQTEDPAEMIRLWNTRFFGRCPLASALAQYLLDPEGNRAALAVAMDEEWVQEEIGNLDRPLTREDLLAAGVIEEEEASDWIFHWMGYRISKSWSNPSYFYVFIKDRTEGKQIRLNTLRDFVSFISLCRAGSVSDITDRLSAGEIAELGYYLNRVAFPTSDSNRPRR